MHKRITRIKLYYNKREKTKKVRKNTVKLWHFKLLFKFLEYLALVLKILNMIKNLRK